MDYSSGPLFTASGRPVPFKSEGALGQSVSGAIKPIHLSLSTSEQLIESIRDVAVK
jgi:hypothetical protein